MKKRRFVSISVALLMAISIITTFPMSVWAGSNYEAELDNSSTNITTLKKNLVIENNANIPACSFIFKASAGDAVPATSTTLVVMAGVGTDKIKFGDETTGDGDGTITYSAQNIDLNDTTKVSDDVTITSNYPDNNYYTATKSITLDFSKCGFTEPGVYRYIITESGSETNLGITNDDNLTRTIDVYVEDATTTDSSTDTTTKKLKITGYVMYVGTPTTGPSNATSGTADINDTNLEDGTTVKADSLVVANATKSVGFKNTYNTHDLTFSKTVTGNQGSKDKYFKFTVNISGATAGTIYDVDISKADNSIPAINSLNVATKSEYAGSSNPTSITVGTGGTSSTDFYLQHGQSIVIKGIADGTSYTITEVQEDYTPSVTLSGDTMTGDNEQTNITTGENINSISDTALKNDTNVAFSNNRSGTIPTGIILSVAPTAIIGLIVIGGIVFLIIRNKKRKYEE